MSKRRPRLLIGLGRQSPTSASSEPVSSIKLNSSSIKNGYKYLTFILILIPFFSLQVSVFLLNQNENSFTPPPDVHGTSMLEDNLMTIQSVCDSADHILAIIPSKQLSPSVAPSLAATVTQSLASPAHMKSQELINLVVSINDALRIKENMRVEQQVDFHATLQSFQRDQLRREEDAKLNFQRYAKEVERQLKDTQHQCNILKQEHTLDQSRIKFLEDRQQEDRQRIKDLEDKQQQDSSRIQDFESSLLEEKKLRAEEKEASDKEKEASEKEKSYMLMRIEEIEDEHIETAGWVSGAVSIDHLMQL